MNIRIYEYDFEIFYEIINCVLVLNTTMNSCCTVKLVLPILNILLKKLTKFNEIYQNETDISILSKHDIEKKNDLIDEKDIKFILISIKCKI
jgi:hypothetical protein